MNIISQNFLPNLYTSKPAKTEQDNRFGLKFKQGLTSDVFVSSANQSNQTSPISFGSSTSNGAFLREFKYLHDAYSDIILLNKKLMPRIEFDIYQKSTTQEKLDVLSPYKKSMLPVEKCIYSLLKTENKKNPNQDMQQILQKYHNNAINNLTAEQQNLFGTIWKMSKNITPKYRTKLSNILNDADERLRLPLDSEDKFKRKTFINKVTRLSREEAIDAISKKISTLSPQQKRSANDRFNKAISYFTNYDLESNINGKTPIQMINELQQEFAPQTIAKNKDYDKLVEISHKLPTSKDNVNAFIVKYSSRKENEIAKRILSQSVITIEHMLPDSLGGPNEAHNFMAASKSLNEERGNMSGIEFKKRHPELPRTMQQYANDIIKYGNCGRLKGHEWYPYVWRDQAKKIYDIDIDISGYNIKPEKAFLTCPQKLKNKYSKYREFMS